MKRMLRWIPAVIFVALFVNGPSVYAGGGGLDDFLRDLNRKAVADIKSFTTKLSTTFGLPVPQVDVLLKKVAQPSDAYMILQVGKIAQQPTDRVLQEYQANKGKGWGVIAKNLGIKPGSPEFHALKRGDFGGDAGPGQGPGKGRGKGHKKKGHD